MPNPWLNVHKSTAAMNYFFSNMKAIIQFSVSDEFKDMLFEQYKVANCGEIADVMTTAFFPVFFSLNVNLTCPVGSLYLRGLLTT
jgi:hypothetical protein